MPTSRSARTSSAAAIAMLPVAEEHKKILIVEPAVADQITGDKWNRYIFRTGRNSSQDAISNAVAIGKPGVHIATLAQDYAFGRDGVAAFKEALAKTGANARRRGIRPRQHRRLHRRRPAPVRRAQGQAGPQDHLGASGPAPAIRWTSSPTSTPAATASSCRPAATFCRRWPPTSASPAWRARPTTTTSIPKNPVNDWLVAEHQKRFNAPPDFFTAGGFTAAMAVVDRGREGEVDRYEKR